MNKKIITIMGVIAAVSSAILGSADVGLIPANWSFFLGIISLAATAAGSALQRSSGSLIVTILGVVIGVTGAIAPQLSSVNEKWGRSALLIGAIAAAFGKSLFPEEPDWKELKK